MRKAVRWLIAVGLVSGLALFILDLWRATSGKDSLIGRTALAIHETKSAARSPQSVPVAGEADTATPSSMDASTLQADLLPPFGLQWGMSIVDAKKALRDVLKLKGRRKNTAADVAALVYTGFFDGLATESIDVRFTNDRLVSVIIMLAIADVRPASKRWEDVVHRFGTRYGAPSSITEPTEEVSLKDVMEHYPNTKNRERMRALADLAAKSAAVSKYQNLDRQIQSGAWEPDATWTFANASGINVGALAGPPNQTGERSLIVTIGFAFVGDKLALTNDGKEVEHR